MFVDGIASTKQRLAVLAVGLVVLFVGVALLSSRIVRPLAALVGAPAGRTGGVRPDASPARTSVRNPDRTASTAAALMIGLALVTVVALARSRTATGRQGRSQAAGALRLRGDLEEWLRPLPDGGRGSRSRVSRACRRRLRHPQRARSPVPQRCHRRRASTRTRSRRSSSSTGSRDSDPFNYLSRLGLTLDSRCDRRQKFADKHELERRRPARAHDPGRRSTRSSRSSRSSHRRRSTASIPSSGSIVITQQAFASNLRRARRTSTRSSTPRASGQ